MPPLSRDLPPERIRFGLTEEHAAAYLPGLLATLADTYPEVQVEVVCDVVLRAGGAVQGRQAGSGPGRASPADQNRPRAGCGTDDLGRPRGLRLHARHGAAAGTQSRRLPVPGPCARRPSAASGGRGASPMSASHRPASTSPSGQAWQSRSRHRAACRPTAATSAPGVGLPSLGLAEIEMHVSPAQIGEAFQYLVDLVETQCRRGSAG